MLAIDAPELKQACKHPSGRGFLCSRFAAGFLLDLVRGKRVFCKGDNRDQHRRLLAICHVNGEDLNARMVREGWALGERRLSKKYTAEETTAKQANKRLWGMQFTPPWEWRKNH
ncbi:MAG TPA: thermonuclease family protein [Rhodospirillales bacterium]|nr:thermonuclease family protein [Rhodospirillales bacterium]